MFVVSEAKAVDSYDTVRVKLTMGNIKSTPVVIDGNYSIADDPSVVLSRKIYTVKIEGSNLSLYDSGTRIYTKAINLGDTDPNNDYFTIKQHLGTEGLNNVVYLENERHGTCAYLGDLRFSIYNGYIRVINCIYIEEYLYGVVPYEMSNSWPQEALQAQAITARTYVERYMGGSGDYDVVDTPANQTYHGYNAAYTNAIAAVDATAKQVLMSGGEYVATFYAASNGGQIDITQHIWVWDNTLKPYHVIKDDPYDVANPYSKEETLIFPKVFSETQSVEYTSDTYQIYEVKEDLDPEVYAANALRYIKISSLTSVAAAGYIAQVTGDIEIVGVNSITPHTYEGNHGGVYDGDTVLYDGNDYNHENNCVCFEEATIDMTVLAYKYVQNEDYIMLGDVNGDGSVSIADYTMIRLHILELSQLSQEQILAADVNGDGSVSIADYTMVRLHILELSMIPQDDPGTLVQEEVTVQFEIDMHEFDKADGLYRAFFSASLRLFVVEETETGWNIYHRRFGHGIGMSQRGAQQMAQTINPETITAENPEGRVYNGMEILEFYYPNTSIDTMNIEKPPLTPLEPPPET